MDICINTLLVVMHSCLGFFPKYTVHDSEIFGGGSHLLFQSSC